MPVWVVTKRDSALICSCSARVVFAGAVEVSMIRLASRVNWAAEMSYSVVNLVVVAVPT